MRIRVLAAVAVLVGFVVGNTGLSANEIVLGLSFGKTGLYSTTNKTTEIAVDIAVAEINAAGGVNGKKIRIVKFDTAGDPKQAVVAVRKFARDDKALGVIDRSPPVRRVLPLLPVNARKLSKFRTHHPLQNWRTNIPTPID